ncbi:MAG TPA: polysaccharide biosynthesis tyrosine autokinase [Actinomycetes bacterium]|nr:polysaccharide biosynthesis tyrosine autokinase [Actinomycetes bacterium]
MGGDAINLRDQVAVLRRRWRLIALTTVIFLAAALAMSLSQDPLYRSSTTIEITPVSASQVATNGIVMQPSEIATEIQVLLSDQVADRVRSSLKLSGSSQQLLDTISVQQQSDTRVIVVSATRPTAAEARDVAEQFAANYLTFRRDQAEEQNAEALLVLSNEAKDVRSRINTITAELETASGAKQAQLETERDQLNIKLLQIQTQQADIATSSPAALGNGGQVLIKANVPGQPAEPQPVKAGLLGAFVGLVLGIGLAFVRDHFDDGLRDETRLREAIAPRPVLGRIPTWTNARTGRLVTVLDPASQVSEAYRALSTSIRFMLAVTREPSAGDGGVGRGRLAKAAPGGGTGRSRGRILVVTSALQAEGKTSVASNLGVVAARFGLRVIVVDADLRNPQLAGVFGLGRPPGLSDLLASDDDFGDYILDVEDMRVLPGGSLAPNPAELLASPRMRDLLESLAESADLVVVDTAPVNRVSDALELVGVADVVLLVARHAQTRLRSVAEAIEAIHQVGGEVSGAVYVDVPARAGAEAYGYGYTAEPGQESPDDDADAATPPASEAAAPAKPSTRESPTKAPAATPTTQPPSTQPPTSQPPPAKPRVDEAPSDSARKVADVVRSVDAAREKPADKRGFRKDGQ